MVAQYAVLASLIYGHLALWIACFNRTHSFNLPGRWIRFIELTQILAAIAVMLLIIDSYFKIQPFSSPYTSWGTHAYWLVPYGALAVLFAAWNTVGWIQRKMSESEPPQLEACEEKLYRLGREFPRLPAQGWSTRLFAYLPTNQMFDLCVNEKTLRIPRLPPELNGLTLLHISDLHFCGKITLPFFERVFDHAVSLPADFVVLTGDILEAESCYEWLPCTLGRLSAKHRKYFVLGNHDRRLRDVGRLRRELTQLGYSDLHLQSDELTLNGRTIQFAGNELPWSGPPAEPPVRTERTGLKILLSHSPDQLPWARARDFDLMLAGHTHGGHIRLPLIGPIVCPSRYGVRYAGGLFYEPPTVLHVSRGISGLDPLRFNCPPEITRIVLRSAQGP